MNKYDNGKIYKIWSPNTDNIYIGSTCTNLNRRLIEHKSKFKAFNDGNEYHIRSFDILKFDNCQISLLEAYPCNSKQELHQRERFWIENQPNCVNKCIPTRIHTKEYKRKYAQEYRQTEKNIKYRNQYQDSDKNRKKALDYYKKHCFTIISCSCGCNVKKTGMSRHRRSNKHNEFLIAKYAKQIAYFQQVQDEYNKNNLTWESVVASLNKQN